MFRFKITLKIASQCNKMNVYEKLTPKKNVKKMLRAF